MSNHSSSIRSLFLTLSVAISVALVGGCSKDNKADKAGAVKTKKSQAGASEKAAAKDEKDEKDETEKAGRPADEAEKEGKTQGEEGEKGDEKVGQDEAAETDKIAGAEEIAGADNPPVNDRAAEPDKGAEPEPAAGTPVAHPTDPPVPMPPTAADADKAAVEPAPVPAPAPTPVPVMQRPTVKAGDRGPPLDITGYLSAADLERVLGGKLKFRRTKLPGKKAHKGYNSLYYADSKGKEFGVSVQVWRDRNLVDSRTRFNTMRNTYSEVVETNRVTAQGFRSFYGDVVSLVFADPRRPMLASVSCSIKFCTADSVIELSRRVAGRMR